MSFYRFRCALRGDASFQDLPHLWRDLSELRNELRVLLREWDHRLARIPVGAQARLLGCGAEACEAPAVLPGVQ